MLKITKTEEKTTTTLKLEGRLAGVWVNECLEAWKALIPTLQERELYVDIRDVTFVDPDGAQLLAQIYRKYSAHFLTGSPLTQYFADQAIRACAHTAESSGRKPDGKGMIRSEPLSFKK